MQIYDYLDFDYSNFIFNQKIFDLFTDKTIALIGPAPTLEGYHLGEWIDSFDVVCRINLDFYIEQQYKIDYGSKCDVLFYNCVYNVKYEKNVIDFLKYIVPNFLILLNNEPVENCRKNSHNNYIMFDLFKNNGSYCYASGNYFKKVCPKFNTGYLSLLFLLHFNLKKLFVGGCRFIKQKILIEKVILIIMKTTI